MTTSLSTAPDRLLPKVVERETQALGKPVQRARPAWPARVLVATDGSPSADAAIATSRVLAHRFGASVEMIAIYSPRIPMPASPNRPGLAQCEAPDRGEAARLLGAVRAQRIRLLPDRRERADWSLRLEVGDPGPTIIHEANEISADLIVVGIGPPDPVDRRVTGHTALCVARYARIPLYAAANGCEAPTRCVVALPDGQAQTPTLRAAVSCLLPGSRMWLAVPDRPSARVADGIESAAPRDVVMRACGTEFAGRIDAIEIERVEVGGDVLAGVLRLAAEVGAHLIAIPNHGDPGPVRLFLPNVAEPVLLGARCSVLVVPDEPSG